MPAKLDISKPLRLIGLQIFDGTSKAVRKSLAPGWYPFISCKKDIGLKKNVYPEVADDICPTDFYKINEDLPRISVSAIAGKNGCGKSTLLDIIYRIINNFTENTFLMKGIDETDEIGHAFGIEGRLHFEQDGVQKFIDCNDLGTDYFEVVNGKKEQVRIHGLTELQRSDILNGFFYTICVNYSLYAFNPSDSQSPFKKEAGMPFDETWVERLFHKNDGYYKPIVLTPFRDNGQIDVNIENQLAKQRIEVLSLMFHSQGKEFLDDYVPNGFSFRLSKDYKERKMASLVSKPIKSEIKEVTDILIFRLENIWENVLQKELKRLFSSVSDRDKNALFYLAYKTLKISLTYPEYKELSHFEDLLAMKKPVSKTNKEGTPDSYSSSAIMMVDSNDVALWLNRYSKELDDLVEKMYHSQCTHITLKIHQCLDYLKEGRYTSDDGCWDVDKDLLRGRVFETYDDLMRILPPPFFQTEVTYKKKGSAENKLTLQTMSSGERQMLYSLSYIYYHIKNIASIKENGKRVVRYHHINLIFDEAELYYHPEFQRQYLKRLLERLSYCHINKSSIRSINILIITHSPFILSDIPKSNILFLKKSEDGKESVENETLGANIYDLLKSGFFLDYAIGDLVQQKLQDILDCYYNQDETERNKMFEKNKDEYRYTISHMGEDYIRRSFQILYDQMEEMYCSPQDRRKLIEQQVRYHEKQVRMLTEKLMKDEASDIS